MVFVQLQLPAFYAYQRLVFDLQLHCPPMSASISACDIVCHALDELFLAFVQSL